MAEDEKKKWDNKDHILHYYFIPRGLMIGSLLIAVFLFMFLAVGCSGPESLTSSIYLLRFEYNESNPLFAAVADDVLEQTKSRISEMKVFVGFAGICTQLATNGTLLCSKKQTELHPIPNITVNTKDTNVGVVQLFNLAQKFSSSSVVSSSFAMAVAVILAITLSLIVVYTFVPVRSTSKYHFFSLFMVIVSFVLVTAFASMTQAAISAYRTAITAAGFELVTTHAGRKARAIMWSGFVFSLCSIFTIYSVNRSAGVEFEREKEFKHHGNNEAQT